MCVRVRSCAPVCVRAHPFLVWTFKVMRVASKAQGQEGEGQGRAAVDFVCVCFLRKSRALSAETAEIINTWWVVAFLPALKA